MRRLLTLGVGLGLLLMPMVATNAASDDPVLYLHPDGSDRYRPAVDQSGNIDILANIDSITAPALSRDGLKVAFSGATGDESLGTYAIFVVGSSGGGLTQLTDGSFGEFDPAWSPDGEKIVVSQNQGGSLSSTSCCRLALVDVSTGSISGLTGAVGAARPAYSSSGSYIVYDTPQGVWRISPSGGSPSLVASGGFDATASPSGASIAYITKNGSNHEIRTSSAGGGSVSVLYQTSGVIENPTWDGSRIYFLEHAGLGYDGRSNVTLRSVSQAGSEFRIERSFSTHVAGLSRLLDNDEMFFYRDDGIFRYYQIRGDGVLAAPMASGNGYTKNWSSINSIDLDGDGLDEMFFYRSDGLFRFYDLRSDGSLGSPMAAGSGYTKGWDSIAAIDLDGDGQDEIFFYRRDGLFRFYDIRPSGVLPAPFSAGSTYSTGWDSIVAVDVDGDGQDEMLFYRDDGRYRLYDVSSRAILGPPMQSGENFTPDWSSISAVDLDGDGADELFFYRADGVYKYYDVGSDGRIGGLIHSGDGYTSNWSVITSVNVTRG